MAQTTVKETKQTRRRLSPKAAAILFLIIVIIAAVIIGIIRWNQWRNNGARYAQSLSEQIGVSPETAQKYARLTLATSSQYPCINMAANGCPYLYESKGTVEVSGVTIPEWLIYIKTTNNVVTGVSYYDYRQLKSYGNGEKTKAHIGIDGITVGMEADAVETYVGFAPLCVDYTAAEMTEHYKYYYKDENTGNTVSYILSVQYQDGKVTRVSEEENVFILSVLTLK